MEERFETFTVLINQINRNIRKIKNLAMADYDLRSPHISCLYHLYSAGGLTPADLCEKCNEDKATISRSLHYLREHGYITCKADTVKKYKRGLSLTEKGTAAGKRIADKINQVLEEIGAGIPEEERLAFYHCLRVVSDCLEDVAKQHCKE